MLEKLLVLGIFYGTYAVLVIPAVWTYYTAVITLLSAELAIKTFTQKSIAVHFAKFARFSISCK